LSSLTRQRTSEYSNFCHCTSGSGVQSCTLSYECFNVHSIAQIFGNIAAMSVWRM